jgi:hypothetical protein
MDRWAVHSAGIAHRASVAWAEDPLGHVLATGTADGNLRLNGDGDLAMAVRRAHCIHSTRRLATAVGRWGGGCWMRTPCLRIPARFSARFLPSHFFSPPHDGRIGARRAARWQLLQGNCGFLSREAHGRPWRVGFGCGAGDGLPYLPAQLVNDRLVLHTGPAGLTG